MKITVSGKNVKVTDALHDYAHEKVSKFEHIWHGISNVQVVLQVEHDVHIVESILSIDGSDNIVGNLNGGIHWILLGCVAPRANT